MPFNENLTPEADQGLLPALLGPFARWYAFRMCGSAQR
jgi:hypothetical protein